MIAFYALDLEASGYNFTWRNKVFDHNIIKKRLDKAVCSPDWFLLYPMSKVFNKPFLVSDQCPITIQVSKENEFPPKPFRFFEAWCRDPSCRKVITLAWNSNVLGSLLSNFAKNWELRLTKWSFGTNMILNIAMKIFRNWKLNWISYNKDPMICRINTNANKWNFNSMNN